MENKLFIELLSQNNANYNNSEQAITAANLCDTISKDINTDSKRFIYELLQNADDASSLYGKLEVQIDFVGEYVVVSHKGEAFSKIDIESISSAGDGTKSGDSNKTGFKGIGFKSVFSHSSFVIIKSGNICFKFDKHHWLNHWNKAWGSENNWKIERKAKNKDENLKMPWQIIPIWTELPNELKISSVYQEYNVSTIIRYDKIEELKNALTELFSESQIVLFLRSKEVKISINTTEKLVLEKSIIGETTILKRNGVVLSEWLIKTEQFDIPKDVQTEINEDEKSPKKLKEASRTEISFAIQLVKGRLKAVDKENRLIYTYLPTSINYDFPFLVNASFLTDAGRQHLHQDTFWNNWIFNQIPLKFFDWVSELASKGSKYNKQFLSIIPHKLGGSLLECSFNEGYKQALETIAFIPNLNGDLLKVKNTVFDKSNISEFINPQTLINYINNKKQQQFTISSFVPYLDPIGTLSRLGTEIFDIEDLEGFFASDIFESEHQLQENFKLISFLNQQAQRNNDEEGRNIWNEKLKQTPFIFDENQKLKRPNQIYFPAVEFSNDFTDNISIIHKSIVNQISANQRIKTWLEYLGIKEPSDISFIEKTIIADGETFVTQENAIEIGRYLFNAHKKGILTNNHYSDLRRVNILTKLKNLKKAQDCFLSDFYAPNLKLEKIYDCDFYVSESYFVPEGLPSAWKTFFLLIGVKDDIEPEHLSIVFDYEKKWRERFDNIFLEEVWNAADKYSWVSWEGWTTDSRGYGFSPESINFYGLPFLQYTLEYNFSKLYFGRVFSKLAPSDIKPENSIYVRGWTGMIGRVLSTELNLQNCHTKYFQWIIDNLDIFPTLNKECRKASDIFINTTENKELAGQYLPILDYDEIVSPEWKKILKFKERLELDDYLEVLKKISQVTEEVELKENKKRIELIYEKLALMNMCQSEKEKIKDWGISNKLMAKNCKDFFFPIELSIVTVEGFRAANLAFTDKTNPEIIELLRLFGAQIIDKVVPSISNSKVEITDLKTKLLQVSPLIALVAVEKSKNLKEWKIEFERIHPKISNIHFFETEEIYLSYGNEEDRQKRSSWSENDNFYYVGKWYNPRVLDGLVEPLGTFFKIRYAERILTVLLLETFAGGVEYLKEKGYDISLIPDELLNPHEQEVRVINQGNREYNQSDEDLGKQGERFVFKELKRIYTTKYNQPIAETTKGFKIDGKVEVLWQNISANTTHNHDFKIVDLNKEIYIDSKATPYGKNAEKVPLYISGNELELMERADKYLIARVYNATSEHPTMELVKLKVEDLTS